MTNRCILGIYTSEESAYYRVVRYLVAILIAVCASGATVVASAICTDGPTVQTATGASCSGPLTSAFANTTGQGLAFGRSVSGLPGFTVAAMAVYSGNGALIRGSDATARIDGDYTLTLSGGTGLVTVQPCYQFLQIGDFPVSTGAAIGTIGSSVFSDNGTGIGCANGFQQGVAFGVPVQIHISLYAHAITDAVRPTFAEAGIALQGFRITDPLNPLFQGATYTLVEVGALAIPEPASMALIGSGILMLVALKARSLPNGLHLRHSANPAAGSVRRSLHGEV